MDISIIKKENSAFGEIDIDTPDLCMYIVLKRDYGKLPSKIRPTFFRLDVEDAVRGVSKEVMNDVYGERTMTDILTEQLIKEGVI
jgi:hypothetical protein